LRGHSTDNAFSGRRAFVPSFRASSFDDRKEGARQERRRHFDSTSIVLPKENCGTYLHSPLLAAHDTFRKISGGPDLVTSFMTARASPRRIVIPSFPRRRESNHHRSPNRIGSPRSRGRRFAKELDGHAISRRFRQNRSRPQKLRRYTRAYVFTDRSHIVPSFRASSFDDRKEGARQTS